MLVEELETGNTLLRKQGDEIFSLQALAEASPTKPVRSEVLSPGVPRSGAPVTVWLDSVCDFVTRQTEVHRLRV